MSNYCGGCNAVFYDFDGENVLPCINPCDGVCGTNAKCNVINQKPICSCAEGYTGDPFLKCERIPDCDERTHGCPEIYSPHCGSDGKTYENECMFKNAQCEDTLLKLKHVGSCQVPTDKPYVDPFDKIIYCATNDANYCEEKTEGVFDSCHNAPQPKCVIDNNVVENCYGICAPENEPCGPRKHCRSIGDRNGDRLTARCLDNKCVYAPGILSG